MRVFLTLLRRELAAFFLSITGYVIIAAVTLLIGLGFDVLMSGLMNSPDPADQPLTELFYDSYYFWVIVLLITPVITMRLFALEKYSGTFETLMTTPVGDVQVVAAKFTAAVVFYMVAWLPMLACLCVVRHFANQAHSLGCFASSLTRSQMAAAMVSLVLGVTLFSLAFLAWRIETPTQWQSQVLSYFDLFDQMNAFARGMVDTKAVIFYVTLTFLFLFLTLRVVESRRWK
jgi:ABC-2 type transport system permease protein